MKHKERHQTKTLGELKAALKESEQIETELIEENPSSDVHFRPTMFHRRVKSKFLFNYHSQEPKWLKLHPIKSLSISEIVQLAEGCPAPWLRDKNFMAWLRNENEIKETASSLGGLALEALEEIIQTKDPKAQSARVSAIKMALELADAFPRYELPTPKKAIVLDELIAKLSESQLRALLEGQGGTNTVRIAIESTPQKVTVDSNVEDADLLPESVEEGV